jgi:hypothetical protein
VKPTEAPHEPSVETPVAVATAPLDVAVPAEEDARVDAQAGGVKTDDVATRLPLRYQFDSGSPMHSPIVTPLYPFWDIWSRM